MAENDMLSVFKESTREAEAFENHPIAKQGLEQKILYLQALAMVMNADNEMHPAEQHYLKILANSFALESQILDSLNSFVQAPDAESIQAFVKTFRRNPLTQVFLFDALMMTRRDGKVLETEMALVNAMADKLEIIRGTRQDIYDLFCHIKNRKWQESALYFAPHLLNPEHFKHLLAYHEMDFEELMAETTGIRRNRLIAALQQHRLIGQRLDDLKWESLRYVNADAMPEADEITKAFVTPGLSHKVLVPFLQARLDRGELKIKNGIIVTNSEEETACGNLADLALDFDQEALSFSVKPNYQGGNNLHIPSCILVEYFTWLMGTEIDKPESVNLVLESLYGCQIAFGKRYSLLHAEVCFPWSNGAYLEGEIVMAHDGSFRICSIGPKGMVTAVETSLNVAEVLASGRIRLMRKGKKV